MHRVEVEEDEAPRRVIGVAHRGAYQGIGAAFGRLERLVAERGLEDERIAMLGIYFSDPGKVPEAELREGYLQKRATAGRMAPRGFPRDNRFT